MIKKIKRAKTISNEDIQQKHDNFNQDQDTNKNYKSTKIFNSSSSLSQLISCINEVNYINNDDDNNNNNNNNNNKTK